MQANNVLIPQGYFFTVSKNEYSDYKTRLGQEILQNSVDAKATRIDITLTDKGYEIRDNGKGMTAKTMVDALLTFGGSAKDEGAAGGFGHAKILILFAMANFEIHSRNTKAIGEGLQYILDENNPEYVQGTLVRGEYPIGWNSSVDEMVRKVKNLLSKSELSADVYINGERFTNWLYTTRCAQQNEWSKLYTRKTPDDRFTVIVRKNGMFMFEKYLGQGIKKSIVLEVTKNSKEVFTANRDGLRPDADKEFSELFARIAMDKKSFDKAKPRRFVFAGMADHFAKFMESLSEHTANIFHNASAMAPSEIAVVRQAIASSDLETLTVLAQNNPSMAVASVAREAAQYVRNTLLASFVVDMSGTSHDSIPKRYAPNTMAETNKAIARLWKSCLDHVFQANRLSARYRIGFILNPDTAAQYQNRNGVEEFLINPDAKMLENDKWKKVYSVLISACHEIAHRASQYHDENFILTEEELLINTLTFIKGDTNVLSKAAKNIEL